MVNPVAITMKRACMLAVGPTAIAVHGIEPANLGAEANIEAMAGGTVLEVPDPRVPRWELL